MIRAFVAIELGEALRTAVTQIQQQLKGELGRELRRRGPDARVQWVRPDAMHLTVKFLGAVPEPGLGEIEEAMASAVRGRAPTTLEVGGLGVFPDARAPRVVWLGLSGAVDHLVDLAGALDGALAALGYPAERRPFQPHLTLARIKEGGRDVGRALEAMGWLGRPERVGALEVAALALMKSDLQPAGAVYTRLAEVRLAPRGE